jgi:hypothetical protein
MRISCTPLDLLAPCLSHPAHAFRFAYTYAPFQLHVDHRKEASGFLLRHRHVPCHPIIMNVRKTEGFPSIASLRSPRPVPRSALPPSFFTGLYRSCVLLSWSHHIHLYNPFCLLCSDLSSPLAIFLWCCLIILPVLSLHFHFNWQSSETSARHAR